MYNVDIKWVFLLINKIACVNNFLVRDIIEKNIRQENFKNSNNDLNIK